ncbi:MAG: HEAT repeat domain-containing protein [Methylacidiphilales bacterium]|nr:HEAT repeat domain-containing protein [Candidatus Methylacidiphilales bacterium]
MIARLSLPQIESIFLHERAFEDRTDYLIQFLSREDEYRRKILAIYFWKYMDEYEKEYFIAKLVTIFKDEGVNILRILDKSIGPKECKPKILSYIIGDSNNLIDEVLNNSSVAELIMHHEKKYSLITACGLKDKIAEALKYKKRLNANDIEMIAMLSGNDQEVMKSTNDIINKEKDINIISKNTITLEQQRNPTDVDFISRIYNNGDLNIIKSVISALGLIGHACAIDILYDIFQKESFNHKIEVIKALSIIDYYKSERFLSRIAFSKYINNKIRLEALKALCLKYSRKLGVESSFPEDFESMKVAFFMLKALHNNKRDSFYHIAKDVLNSKNDQLLYFALDVLIFLKDELFFEYINVLLKDKNKFLYKTLLRYIQALDINTKKKLKIRLLCNILYENDAHLQIMALDVLSNFKCNDIWGILKRKFNKATSLAVKISALNYMFLIDKQKAMCFFEEIMRDVNQNDLRYFFISTAVYYNGSTMLDMINNEMKKIKEIHVLLKYTRLLFYIAKPASIAVLFDNIDKLKNKIYIFFGKHIEEIPMNILMEAFIDFVNRTNNKDKILLTLQTLKDLRKNFVDVLFNNLNRVKKSSLLISIMSQYDYSFY